MRGFRGKILHYNVTLFLLMAICCQLAPVDAFADFSYGMGRQRSCAEIDGAVEGMDFDPTTGGKDAQFVMTNAVCLSVIASSYAMTKSAIAVMNNYCKTGSKTPRFTPSPLLDSVDIARGTAQAAKGNAACGVAVATASSSFAASIAMIGPIYEIAKSVFKKAKICGADWKAPNPKQFLYNTPNYKQTIENKIEEWTNDPLQRYKLSLDNKEYREWFYGGVEVENPGCPDVTQDPGSAVSGEKVYPAQKYYLRGFEIGNYNCQKYEVLVGDQDPSNPLMTVNSQRAQEFKDAHNCCVRASQNYICLEYDSGIVGVETRKFCKVGEQCEIGGIYFESKAYNNGSMICAQTYSLCPYNFYIGGGTQGCDYFQDGKKVGDKYEFIKPADIKAGNCGGGKSEIRNDDCSYNNKAGKCRNYCQYMRHCTKVNDHFQYRSSLASPYFSRACLNFVGDSQNKVFYGSGFIAGSARHFSAPIAQCFKETLENVFYNRAGHTKCLRDGDQISSSGDCFHGNAYKDGEQVKDRSFFERLQEYLIWVVKIALTLSITLYGARVMIAGEEVKKKDLLMFITKIGLVMFFATGGAWQKFFFDGVYSASTVFSQIIFKLEMPDDENKRDGCQFGTMVDENGAPVLSPIKYPKGKEYLAIWDSLDCKIARYMGFGPSVSEANIAKLILAGFITGSAGIYFSIALFIFAFMFISATIKALHIFLASSFAILIMVYVSPLVITGTLFKKTEGIFKSWLQQLISFIFQPIILFGYIAIFLTITDKTLTGSATFYGEGPIKSISCSSYCVNAHGYKVDAQESPQCDRVGERTVKPKSDSFACLIGLDGYSNWPGLEIIGISLPFIIELFTDDVEKKILTILKAALIMFFLDRFMGEIPNIAKQLIGGSGLPMSGPATKDIFKGVAGLVRGAQKRSSRASEKAASGAIGKAAAIASRAAELANKGKAVKSGEEAGADGEDKVGDSNLNNGDNAKESKGNNGDKGDNKKKD